ncbi:MAG: ABC transporter permease [Spirochaetales bacterium]
MSDKTLPTKEKFDLIDLFTRSNWAVSLLVIALGFVFGSLFIVLVGRNPLNMFSALLQVVTGWDSSRGVWNARYIGEWFVASMPLVLCGLSMAFASRTGLFNIGAEGQYIAGLTAAQFVALMFPPIPGLHWLLCVAAGTAAGALWGGIAGWLKAKYTVSEVVTTIMLNYIALYLSQWVTQAFAPGANTYRTKAFPETALLQNDWISVLTNGSRLSNGLWFMLLSVLFFWFVIDKTRLGFSLRATGLNKEAARASGIKVQSAITTSMLIAGAFAGLAGVIVALGSFSYGRVLPGMENYGFNGIAVALVGNVSAIGSLLAGLLFGMLNSAQPLMQSRDIPKEITWIIFGLVVVFISFRNGFKLLADWRARQQSVAQRTKS